MQQNWAKYIWQCKVRGSTREIKWKILRNATPYHNQTKTCKLCLAEKFEILTGDPKTMLNKRSELVSKCRHKAKFKLKNLKS